MGSLVPFTPTPDVAEFADIIIDSAVLMVDGEQITLSRGGWTFEPNEEWEDYAFPGRTMNTVGCRQLVRLTPVIRGTALLSGEDQISVYRPDGTWASHATITGARTFTPNALRAYLTSSDYLTNVVALWKRQRGDYIAVEFPVATCGQWNLGVQDNDEGLFQIVIESVEDSTRVPYRIRKIPTIDEETGEPPTDPDLGNVIWDLDATNPDIDVLTDEGGEYINEWPDASASNLDGNPDTGIGQTSPGWQESSGLPAGVYPRVIATGTRGVETTQLPTNDDFTLYVVGTFGPGWIVRADQGPGNLGMYITEADKLHGFVNADAFGGGHAEGSTTVTTAAHVAALSFLRTDGDLWIYLDGALEDQGDCSASLLNLSYKIRVGYGGDLNFGGSYLNQLKMYDRRHTDEQVATVTAQLEAEWGI